MCSVTAAMTFPCLNMQSTGLSWVSMIPVLEPYAEYITDTVEQDGIWKAMEHLGLI